jgi:phosphate transport system permease protein
MKLRSRKILDRSFTGLGITSILLLCLSLVIVLGPIFWNGAKAFVFRGTVEFRRMILDEFERGTRDAVLAESSEAEKARQPVYDAITAFEEELKRIPAKDRRQYRLDFDDFEKELRKLLGPLPGDKEPETPRRRYGLTRWDQVEKQLHSVLYETQWDYSNVTSDSSEGGRKVFVSRAKTFKGTSLEPVFGILESNIGAMMHPKLTFYWRFITDSPVDIHFFGGIWPEVLGTLYLALGAVIFAVPIGVISAIYLVEYAGQTLIVRTVRTFINTLAGVPSIVFGLFGLAFFIHTVKVSESKSVLAGSLTLALVILPVVIRASEEAIRAVPRTYKEAALSLGASHWRTIVTVLLPAALPGIVTGIVISMGRAAGETAPIIFTAAVSVGMPLKFWEVFKEGTPALSWNIYNLATEHEAADQIRHVQYGMVLTLVALVLLLNAAAIYLRARISKKLRT